MLSTIIEVVNIIIQIKFYVRDANFSLWVACKRIIKEYGNNRTIEENNKILDYLK